MDRWELQDDTISQLRAFATDRNVHISLVVHPRKVPEDQTLDTASIFGSVKVTQEADNVIIVQKKGDLRFLDVRKNRCVCQDWEVAESRRGLWLVFVS